MLNTICVGGADGRSHLVGAVAAVAAMHPIYFRWFDARTSRNGWPSMWPLLQEPCQMALYQKRSRC